MRRLMVILGTTVGAGCILALTFFVFPSSAPHSLLACGNLPWDERVWCYQESIEKPARNGDFEGSFLLLAEAYAEDSAFALDCHGSAHELGRIAYTYFEKGEEIELTPLSSYCGYGFYHGFMEEVLLRTGRAEDAVEFCKKVGEALEERAPDAEGACYHGIGHGAVDGTDPRVWGDPKALVDVGLSLCTRAVGHLPDIPEDRGPLYRCVTGAYNALEILSQNEKYGLEVIARDPFSFCAAEHENYREECSTNMLPAMLRLRQEDFKIITDDIARIEYLTEEEKDLLVADLFHEFVRIHGARNELTHEKGIALCGSLQEFARMPCIEGLSGGELKYGEPTREYEGMLDLCSKVVGKSEAAACFHFGLSRLHNLYRERKVAEVCALAPEEQRTFCGLKPAEIK